MSSWEWFVFPAQIHMMICSWFTRIRKDLIKCHCACQFLELTPAHETYTCGRCTRLGNRIQFTKPCVTVLPIFPFILIPIGWWLFTSFFVSLLLILLIQVLWPRLPQFLFSLHSHHISLLLCHLLLLLSDRVEGVRWSWCSDGLLVDFWWRDRGSGSKMSNTIHGGLMVAGSGASTTP